MDVFDLSATLSLDASNYERGLAKAEGMAKSAGGASGGFTVLKGAMANLVSGGINMVAGALSQNLGKAISRVDTLNNYSIVMGNLGHDSKDAQQAIDTLADGIDGLPTKLDAIASMQQQFAALGGPLTDATDLTIALNNATLAGGRGQEVANSAMQQWYQMIAAGKSDQMSMRIINEAMPAQLDAIAKSVVGANATWKQLDDEWKKNPEITEKVKDAILKLNEEGTDGMSSFEQQAKDATKGIDTSMQNLQTAISKGMANVMRDTGLDKWIAGQLGHIKDLVNGAFDFVTSTVTKLQDDSYGQSLANLVFRLGGMIQEALPSMVNGIVSKMQEMLPEVISQAQSIFETLKDVVFTGLGSLFQNLPNFTEMLADVGTAIFDSITGLVTDIIDYLPNIMVGLNVMFPKIRDTVMNALASIRDNVFEVIDSIIENLPSFVTSVLTFLADQIPVWISEGQKMIMSFAEGIWERLPELIDAVADLIPQIVDFIIKMAPVLISAGQGLMAKLGAGFIKALPKILASVGKLVVAILKGILTLGGKLLLAGGKLALSLANGLGKSVGKLLKAGVTLAGKVVQGVKNGFKSIASVGLNVVKGIWNGISSGYDWIKGKIKGWVGNVTNFLKKLFGIESPSKLMRDEVGKWIPLGIAKGIKDNAGAVEDALDDVVDIPDMADGIIETGSMAGGMKMVSFAPSITVDGAEQPEEYAQRLMREMKLEARMA